MQVFKVALIFILGVLSIGFSSCRSCHSEVSDYVNDVKEIYKVDDVDNRLYNYQWFHSQYNEIQSMTQSVKLMSGSDKIGSIQVLNSMIGEYNSRASQLRNAGKFKDWSLPNKIDYYKVESLEVNK